MSVRVAVQYATRRAGVPHPATVAKWARAALRGRRRNTELTVRFVAAREGRALNRRWRGKDYATNVLSFPGAEDVGGHPWLGDIVICVPVVRAEAKLQRKRVEAHYAHMVVHGVMHLLGHDHVKAREARIMESRETAILRLLGYPDPYQVPRAEG